MNIDQISNNEEQNNNILSNDFFQQENDIQTDPNMYYKKIQQNQKNILYNQPTKNKNKQLIANNQHYITQSLAQKIIQDSNNNLNITPVNQDLINITYTTPEQNRNNNLYNNLNYEDINKEYEPLTDDNEKLQELARNIKENENKIEKMNKTVNEIISSKNKNNEINDMRSFITQINDIEKIQQENITLKADSLIYREDINNLIELNNKYTEELETSRKKILDLISRNNDIEKDINHKDFQINKLNEIIARLRLYENPDMDYKIRNNKTKDEILYELEFNIKVCNEESMKLSNEKKILEEKLKQIINNKNELNKNLILNNDLNNKMVNEMEDKIKLLEKEINNLNNENNILNINNQRDENDIKKLIDERNNIENKYIKKKEEFDKLQYDYSNLNRKYQQLLNENKKKEIMEQNKIREKSIIKKSNKDAIEEMYNKIQILKSQVKQERDIEY